MEWIEKFFSEKNLNEAQAYLTSEGFLIQIGIVVLGFVVGFLVSKIITIRLENIRTYKLRKWSLENLVDAIQDVATPFVALLVVTSGVYILQDYEYNTKLLVAVESLLAAWVVIQFFTNFVKYRVIARWFAFIAWVVAALNIIGYLDEAIEFLDSFAIDVGDTKLSLLVVIKAVVSLVIFVWLANSLAGFLERQLSGSKLNPSLKVLFAKVIRIFLITSALLFSLKAIGIDLTALAIFSGALGVGLGFGLQKIVSNFISGIILLMDRSIKPGDVISVDDTYGWVNRLSSRYVSVITRDGKEHLIPNELMITEKVENWSYSDKNIRLKVPFGVSYDSDMNEVKRLVIEAVEGLTRVIDTRDPVCLMTGFGDSSVDFELRCWIDTPEQGVRNVMSEIYFAIWNTFKDNNIEIPFPQRDVHIKEQPQIVVKQEEKKAVPVKRVPKKTAKKSTKK